MGMNISKTVVSYGIPIWQGDFIKTAQGGFTLDSTGYAAGTVIKGGTPFGINEATRKASPVKVGILQAAAADDATKYRVLKGSGLTVGAYIGAAKGGAAYAISAIDSTTSADYDEITVGTTLGVALAVGDTIFESSATGATAAALKVTPVGLLKSDVTVETNADVAVVIRGTVYENRIPAVPADVKDVLLATIIFSKSY